MAKKSTTATQSIAPPSVLAFSRKQDLSDGLMYMTTWDKKEKEETWKKIKIRSVTQRSTNSHRSTDVNKLAEANIAKTQIASLGENEDTLCVRFILKQLGDVGIPDTSNSINYNKSVIKKIDEYKRDFGFKELAKRYTHNIVSARFLWRNRIGAQKIETRCRVLRNDMQTEWFIFDSKKIGLLGFKNEELYKNTNFIAVAGAIEDGLMGNSNEFIALEVVSFVQIASGQPVYPSEEFIDGDKNKKQGKVLYDIYETAGLHSQKIGNAIRTIDTWYGDNLNAENAPISIEVYGTVSTQGMAYRTNNNSFYALHDRWILNEEEIEEQHKHYVVAMLIRGGVFSNKESKEKKEGSDKSGVKEDAQGNRDDSE